MTLANVPVFAGPYGASAGQTIFNYGFKVFADSDSELVVFVDAVVVATTEYAVTGVGNESGGTVIFNTGLSANQTVLIEGQMDPEQLQEYTPGGAFPAASHELALDRIVRMVQALIQQRAGFLDIGNAGLLASPPYNAILPPPTNGVLSFENGIFSWIDNPGLPDQTGQTGRLLTTDGAVAFWQAFVDFLPTLQAGQFLTNDGAVLSWAVPAGGGAGLPDQTGHAGKVLGTTGVAALWQTLEEVLPTLVPNQVLANNGSSLLWQIGLPAQPAPPPANEFPVLRTDGVNPSWQNLLPPLVANGKLTVDNTGLVMSWDPAELPADPAVDSLLRFNLGTSLVEWIDEETFANYTLAASTVAGADDTAILQAAMTQASTERRLLIIDRSFLVTGVDVPNSITIWFAMGTSIAADVASPPSNSGVLNIHNTTEIRIYGNNALVDGAARFATGNDHHGIDIAGGGLVEIQDLRINRCGGDGIHIGPTRGGGVDYSSPVSISNCYCTQNNASGIRITSGRSVWIRGGGMAANGVAAAAAAGNAGVSVIPDATTHVIENVTISDIETSLHGIGAGIWVDFTAYNDTALTEPPVVTIERHFSRAQDLVGFRYLGMRTTGVDNTGSVHYIDGRIRDTDNQGISVEGAAVDGPTTYITRPTVINPNTAGGLAVQQATGIFFGAIAGGGGSILVGNAVIDQATVLDYANPGNVNNLIRVHNTTVTSQLENVMVSAPLRLDVINPAGTTTAREKVVMLGRDGGVDVFDPMGITRYTAAIDEVVTRDNGNAIRSNDGLSARRTYTLNAPFERDGPLLRFELKEDQPLRVTAPAGARILGGGGDGQYIESRVAGSRLALRPLISGDFEIAERSGPWGFESEEAEVPNVSLTGTTVETTLYQRVFAANALTVGDSIRLYVAGSVEIGTGTNTLRFRFNGVEILSDDINGGSTESWELEARVMVVSSTEAAVVAYTYTRADRTRHECVGETIALTSAQTLAMTMQNSSTSGFVTRRIATCELTQHLVP